MIFNNITSKLSDLDMKMVKSVPEGGNWKNIPETIPSKRLDGIRESYKRGEGSRSTYYGRLRRDKPSYTINTYFNRPGNGCHIHYEQDRVLSQREAARLQSFPDSFQFFGSQNAVQTQIGNAVPPLLAFQIAQTIGQPGMFVDLFSGAGGLGLGFKWAKWNPIVANDIEPTFLNTYADNVHHCTIAGSISDPSIFESIVSKCQNMRKEGFPFWVLGGPPCQGFSTAGNKRSMNDKRNHLVWDYIRFLEKVKPDGFVFENVTGILNMQGGKLFAAVKEEFSQIMPLVTGYTMSCHEYGIPQRRKRVVIVGQRNANTTVWAPPLPSTSLDGRSSSSLVEVQPSITVEEAISDLPHLREAENGGDKTYRRNPSNIYQALMRGYLSPQDYLIRLKRGERLWRPE